MRTRPFEDSSDSRVILRHTQYQNLPIWQFDLPALIAFQRENALMARKTVIFTISVPTEMAAEIERVRKEEHSTRSEYAREAFRRDFVARSRISHTRHKLISQ